MTDGGLGWRTTADDGWRSPSRAGDSEQNSERERGREKTVVLVAPVANGWP